MNSIELKFKNKKDQKLVMALANRLKADRVIKKSKKNNAAAIEHLQALAKTGGIPIENPVQWQQEVRRERSIF